MGCVDGMYSITGVNAIGFDNVICLTDIARK